MIADYFYFNDDYEMNLISKSLTLSSHVISSDKTQLGSQLQARLVDFQKNLKCIDKLLHSIN